MIQESTCPLQANMAAITLNRILQLHPPVRPKIQEVYLKALANDKTGYEKPLDEEWNFIKTCIM